MVIIKLTNRQQKIVEILKKHEPITGDQIAEMLGVSKATIRSDMAVLVMTGYLDSKPKVGYFLGTSVQDKGLSTRLNTIKVKDVQGLPVVIQETTSVHDAVITLFLENIGSLMVVDKDGYLVGIVSRKDLLKVTLGNGSTDNMPVNMVMTRYPNVVTIDPEESVVEAARRMIHFEIDGLPVVKPEENGKQLVLGRITKTNVTKVLLEKATEI